MRQLIFSAIAVCISVIAFSQEDSFKWSGSLDANKSFIENKGQFDQFSDDAGAEVLFAIDGGQSLILFTEKGYTFRFASKYKNPNRKRGEHDKPHYLEDVVSIHVNWDGKSATSELQAVGQRTDRHTYSILQTDRSEKQVENVSGFEKLIYRSVYPNIDIEFTFHEIEGFKYDLILHPGADVADVKMLYSKDYLPKVDANGNLIVVTGFGEIIDHAPVAFYNDDSGEQVEAKFTVSENTVSFSLNDYDSTRELKVDPWVVTPAFPNSNGIWDIDVDNLGNVYVYGGDTPMKLQKYNSTGTLQWTYNTPWDSANYWIGTMITEPNSGDCFITAGTDPRIQRISTGGSMLWNANGGAFDEYWKFAFNCDNTRLMLGGTQLAIGAGGALIEGYGYVFEIDMSNGAQINDVEVASVSPGPLGLVNNPNEVRAMCPSPNGKYYYMTLDTIGVFDDNLALGYQDNHGYGFSYQVAGYGVTNQGINAMAATTDYLYTTNGSVLDKRNIVDGSIITSVAIPNGNTSVELGFASAENGGLVLDSCGNVYAGSSNGVYKFDADLGQLAFQSTNAPVYDIAVNAAGEVVACGQGFVASLNLEPCAPPKAICLNCLELTPAGPYCPSDAPDTLMADPANGIWSGPGIVDEILGIFDPSVADTGTHIIYFAPEIPLVCGIDSLVIEVNFCVDLQACIDSLGDIAIPNGIPPYTWSQTIDTVDCSGCFPAAPPFIQPCSIPPGCAVPSTVVVEFSNDNTVTPTGNWPIYVEDSEGNTLQINSLAEIPACSEGCFIVANLPDTVIACTGDSAAATVSVTGGIGNLTFEWNTNPVQTTQTAFGLAPGAYYTVTVTDDSSCVAMDSVYVVEQECVGPMVCATPFGDMLASGVGPFTWFEMVDSTDCSACIEFPGFPPCSFPPGCGITVQGYQQFASGDMATPTGNWPVAVVDAAGDTLVINAFSDLMPCTETCYIQVSVPETAFTCFGVSDAEVTATVTGAFGNISYSWNTSPVQTSATAAGLGVGEYVITVTDDNSCEATDTVEVVQNPELNVQVSGADSLCLGVTVGNASAFASGGAGNFSYSWSTNPIQTTSTATSLSVGSYMVTVTDAAGCTVQGTWTIEESPSVTVSATSGGDICPETTLGTATAVAANGSAPYAYAWNTTPAQSGANATGLPPGDYQVTATDQDGCQGIASVTIGALPFVDADAGMYTTICLGQSTTLLATGGVDYLWSNGSEDAAIEVSPEETTLYSVTVTDANGCMGSDTVTVFVVPIPLVGIEEVDSVVCDVYPPFQIVGIPPGGVFVGTGITSDGVFSPMEAGEGIHVITYSLESVENCVVDTSIAIRVDPSLCDVITPSIFNPNSTFDGQQDFCGNVPQNNVFSLPCLELYPGNRVIIFDRWGRKCYEEENYHLKPWDGGNQSDGVYYYVLELPDGEVKKGFFHLVR